jgi:hypothetical protein
MKGYSILLFKNATDDEYFEEWAVVAESPNEAERLLREQFGDRWTRAKRDVALAEGEVGVPAGVIGKVEKD